MMRPVLCFLFAIMTPVTLQPLCLDDSRWFLAFLFSCAIVDIVDRQSKGLKDPKGPVLVVEESSPMLLRRLDS